MKFILIIPFRDREEHLKEFIPWTTQALQGIDYKIVVVEQESGKPFNRGKLLNIGFKLYEDADYFCFHDVDMLPVETDYSYCPNPTHLAGSIEQFNWGIPYETYFGGVTIFDKNSFIRINGYSNEYWGWGVEDDDLFLRCLISQIQISRKNCKFKSLHHEIIASEEQYIKNREYFLSKFTLREGLSTLEYEVLDTNKLEFYDRVKVRI